jgi:hypothetical protein
MTDEEAIAELAHELCAVCAEARREHDLSWEEVYSALATAMSYVMRSCDCPDCRKNVLRHARRELPKKLRDAVAYSRDKFCGVVGNC